jgi:histone acetyltransferase HPA2
MQIHIETGDWKTLQHPCERIRLMVFVAEQGVPKAEEIDDLDPVSTHFVAWDEHHMTLGCARITPDGKIGRLAVLKPFRGRGVGRVLMEAVLNYAKTKGQHTVRLNAQTHARTFYEALGFKAEGDVFEECGIPHIKMSAAL